MHTDIRALENGSVLDADLCIVGAGAAGITMALQLINSPLKVLLLEGGGFEREQVMQDLYRGEIVGQPYYPLESARLHYFGGTTGHWAGWCATYDSIDFETRPWVRYSGWPIERADLDPFYARAQPLLDIGPYDYDAASWSRRDTTITPLGLDPDKVWTKMWQFSPPTRFGTKYRSAIVNAPNVHLFTHANVVEVEANDALSAVDGVRIRTLDGKEYRARAKTYVLACCSMQNARLLLASNRKANTGLGNANDLVGRFFMEHLEIPSGELVLANPKSARMKMYAWESGVTKARGELSLSPELQREHRILNGTASLEPGTLGEPVKSTFQSIPPDLLAAEEKWEAGGKVGPSPFSSLSSTAPVSAGPPEPPRFFHLMTRQEQSPNPNSRVTLATEKDRLGMPRVKFNWQLSPLDKRSIRTFYQLLGQEMGRAGVGRIQLRDWLLSDDKTWPSFVSGGWHHMGTTRMHTDPKQGVVDPNCRVHGLANLYIGGAAVYPTAGSANPTLTLVALALRLADHLKQTVA
jgi:choline dehydrogenase-like flavoprotein